MWVVRNIAAISAALLSAFGVMGKAHTEGLQKAALINNPQKAALNWMINCQGCHGVDAMGSPNGAPPMPGVVGKFLQADGGREYLVRVPGVAISPIPDDELADLLNWMLLRFSCDALPVDFKPYDAAEVSALRADVLITQAASERARLLARLSPSEAKRETLVKNTNDKALSQICGGVHGS
jgi:mono/diheme cytochrome c family protein